MKATTLNTPRVCVMCVILKMGSVPDLYLGLDGSVSSRSVLSQ
jgi:hypothetical protein